MNKIMIFLLSLSFVVRGMENIPVPADHKDVVMALIVATGDKCRRKSINNYSKRYCDKFVHKLNCLSHDDENVRQSLQSENMKQFIISTIIEKSGYFDWCSDYEVAEQMAQLDESYTTICQGITNAFDPDGEVKDVWYANAASWVDSKENTCDNFGYFGGYMSPLFFAIKTANRNWVGRLIAEGADVNKWYDASFKIHPLYEVIFVKNNLKNAAQGCCKWHPWVLEYEKVKHVYHGILCLLLKNNALVELGRTGMFAETPLRCAIKNRDEESVLELIKYGATLSDDLKDKDIKWFNELLKKHAIKN